MPETAESMETADQVCPICGCQLGESPYKEGEVFYCCQPCATGGECDCGCCEVVQKEDKRLSG